MSSVLIYLHEIDAQLNFTIVTNSIDAEDAFNLNEKQVLTFSYALHTTNIKVNNSRDFGIQFLRQAGLKAYLSFLSDENL